MTSIFESEFSHEHDHVEPLLTEYALGTIDPRELARVEAHLAGCAGCRATLDELADAVTMLEHAVHSPGAAPTPRTAARADLLAAARRTPQQTPRHARRRPRTHGWRRWMPIAAPSIACAALALIAWNQAGRVDALERDLDEARGDQVPVLRGASVDEFEIDGPFGETRAGVVLKRDAGIVTFRTVPEPPAGTSWHVWAVDEDDHIVPLGTIAEARDLAILTIDGVDPKDVVRIIVTTEATSAEDDPVAEGTV
jgi:anti-sigma-K factor RskA